MSNIEMEAELTIAVGSGLVKKGETFTIEDEERARLYEQAGMAKKVKKKEPERTQDVRREASETAEESSPRHGRPPKARKTKGAGNSGQDVEEADDGGDKGSPDS